MLSPQSNRRTMRRSEPSSTFSCPPRWRNGSCYPIILSIVIILAIMHSKVFMWMVFQDTTSQEKEESVLPFAVGRMEGGCDLFQGSWVYDDDSRPLYQEFDCPYIEPELTCQAHGRPDNMYQHWRWQPHACSLPRFNATFMLEKLRGKRMMFVGDSLIRGQFYSLVCLLQKVIPETAKSLKINGSLIIFRAMEYDASIEFYWAPFFVESNADNPTNHKVIDRIVNLESIDVHARHWKGVDILVCKTYIWWMGGPKLKVLRGGSFQDEVMDIEKMNTFDAYRIALRKMVAWLEKNMDPHATRIFFTGMTALHRWGSWGVGAEDGNCYNETTPIDDPNYWGSSNTILKIIEDVLSESKVPITLLNITQLSEYRKDAHVTIYKQQPRPLTLAQLANPYSYADCVHWCVPGVQDTWNELLYTKLFFP